MPGPLDLSQLNLGVNASGGIRQLNRFTFSAHNAGRATERLERSTRGLVTAIGGVSAAVSIRNLIAQADAWTLINARLSVVTDTYREANTLQERLYRSAQLGRTDLAATSVLFQRLALQAGRLGASYNDLLEVVDGVNASLLLAGSTGVEAAQSMRQLAQAISKGKLDGDEFRTVMEAMPVIAQALEKHMRQLGLQFNSLYELAPEGLITVNHVIDAIRANFRSWLEDVEKMPLTVGQAFILFTNAIARTAGVLSRSRGITDALAGTVRLLERNMARVVAVIGSFVAVTVSATATVLALRAAFLLLQSTQILLGLAAIVKYVGNLRYLLRGIGAALANTGLLPLIVALTVGTAAYNIIIRDVNAAIADWEKNQADLNKVLGEATPLVEDLDKAAIRLQEDIDAMIREAKQSVILAGQQSEAQRRLEIQFEAVNKRFKERARLVDNELLPAMLAAIDAEEQYALQALEVEIAMERLDAALEQRTRTIERFLKNFQRGLADAFEQVLMHTRSVFDVMSQLIHRALIRLVSDIAASQIVDKLGDRFSSAATGFFGESQELVAARANLLRVKQSIEEVTLAAAMGIAEITTVSRTAVEELAGITTGSIYRVQTTAENGLGGIRGFIAGTLNAVKYAASGIWEYIKNLFINLTELIKNTIATAINYLKDEFGDFFEKVNRLRQDISNIVTPIAGRFGDVTSPSFFGGFGGFGSVVPQVFFRGGLGRARRFASSGFGGFGDPSSPSFFGGFGGFGSASALFDNTSLSDFFTGIADAFRAGFRGESETSRIRFLQEYPYGTTRSVPPVFRSMTTGVALPVSITTITTEAEKSFAAKLSTVFSDKMGEALAGVGAGIFLGGLAGNLTGTATGGTILGGLSGAGGGFAFGGPVGAVAGGITGAVSGFITASRKQREEMEMLRKVMRANNHALLQVRDSFLGSEKLQRQVASFGELDRLLEVFDNLGGLDVTDEVNRVFADLLQLAEEMQFVLAVNGKFVREELIAFKEALELTIRSVLQFGNNLQDVQSRQRFHNRIFGTENTGAQQRQDALEALAQLSPQLFRDFFDHIGFKDAQGFLIAAQEIFRLIDRGLLDEKLLGAFLDKNQLLEVISLVVESFKELNNEVSKLTTDFPRVRDIALYAQRHGTSVGLVAPSPPTSQQQPQSNMVVHGGVTINVNGDASGEEILTRMERAVVERRSVGGFVDIESESTF